MILFPNAKINLGLNIVSRRPDGYHNIETVFYPINLCDSLEIVPAPDGGHTTLHSYGLHIDCPPEKNLVTKAWQLLHQEFGIPAAEMHLVKNIPDGGGLGGGSSDASHALIILNDLFSLGLSQQQLAQRAAKLGADCAFFIHNTPLMATGIGDIFTPADVSLKGHCLLLVKPQVSVPTAAAYALVKPEQPAEPITQILKRPVKQWRHALKNDFEPSVFAQHPMLAEIKHSLYLNGADYAAMSGSGSSIYGIFADADAARALQQHYENCAVYLIEL